MLMIPLDLIVPFFVLALVYGAHSSIVFTCMFDTSMIGVVRRPKEAPDDTVLLMVCKFLPISKDNKHGRLC